MVDDQVFNLGKAASMWLNDKFMRECDTRGIERDGVRWCVVCDDAEPRALLDGVVELAQRRDVPMLALPLATSLRAPM